MEDDIKDLDDSIFRATISNSAKSKLPLILPWHPKQTILIGTLFHSSNLTDPWAKNSPFQTHLPDVVVQREDGTEASFRSQSTSSESSSHDHLSLGFGVSVGLPFLATVSVSGTYDKDVFENKDSNKSSIRTSVRAGTVTLTRQPKLTNEAIITIKYHGGLPAFQQRYGDYYVAGYRLGGDTQMMLSGSNSSKRELEKFGVTVKAEVLFVEASTTYTKDFEENGATSELSLIGYDTLDCDNWKCEKGSLALEMQTQAAKVIEKSQSLDVRISGKLNELGIEDGAYLSNETCRKLTEAGLVVELILLPVGTLRQVIEWPTDPHQHAQHAPKDDAAPRARTRVGAQTQRDPRRRRRDCWPAAERADRVASRGWLGREMVCGKDGPREGDHEGGQEVS
ncbi:hypothetical protein B7494_g4481 [Chlorociboria aeruginascens]|nr:hypothetical protein B7494_g4481 [Chlorociboria aeruginascens]